MADIYLGQMHPILAGILIVVVMKFMPGGLIGLVKGGRHRVGGKAYGAQGGLAKQ
jgi:ABC-type branched-subunit amino acid transport system permease subunit